MMEFLEYLIAEAIYHWARLMDKLGLFPEIRVQW
jgi:ribosomal protein S12 methylthiotransferase accessory factor YcaO